MVSAKQRLPPETGGRGGVQHSGLRRDFLMGLIRLGDLGGEKWSTQLWRRWPVLGMGPIQYLPDSPLRNDQGQESPTGFAPRGLSQGHCLQGSHRGNSCRSSRTLDRTEKGFDG